MSVHGLHPAHPNIVAAENMDIVWPQFVRWVMENVANDKVGILVAWNGKNCNLKWLWKLTQALGSSYNMPPRLEYFIDPYRLIMEYESCLLHPKHSKVESLELGVVWKHIMGRNLNEAHDSLVDAKAQTDVVTSAKFAPILNRTRTVQKINEIFARKTVNDWKKEMEPIRPVHAPWKEQTANNNITWTPHEDDCYSGCAGSVNSGPTSYIRDIAAHACDLADIFLAIMPMIWFITVALCSKKYVYDDWVVEKTGKDRDGKTKKWKHFEDCPATMKDWKPTLGCMHRADRDKRKYAITPGYVMCWIGILIVQGSYFGNSKVASRNLWRKAPYGLNIPHIKNSMPRDAYKFMRRYIHFADNSRRVARGKEGYDLLFKVKYPMEVFMSGMWKVWNAGKSMTVDKSMILYNGRTILYVQYMPQKPILHGIKVFAICCAASAVLLGFEVYVGKESDLDGTAIAIIDQLILQAGLNTARGRVLYSDNWYTSMALAIQLFCIYGWYFVGTIVPTDKK